MAESLKYIKVQIQKALQYYPFVFIPNGSVTIIEQISKLKEFINVIQTIPSFVSQYNILRNSIIYTTTSDRIDVAPSEARKIQDVIMPLEILMKSFNTVLEKVVPEELPNSVNIKLPSVIDDFSSLAKISSDLNIAISQILIASDLNCETKITSVENGSIWTNIVLLVTEDKIPATITLIGTLIMAAIKARKIWYDGSLTKEQLRKIKRENDAIDETEIVKMEQTIDARKDKVIDEQAAQIQLEYFKNDTSGQETLNRIKNAINILYEWQEKGLVITPSITAAQQAIDALPTTEETMLIEDKTKVIEN